MPTPGHCCCINIKVKIAFLCRGSKIAFTLKLNLNAYPNALAVRWYRSWNWMATPGHCCCIDNQVKVAFLCQGSKIAFTLKLYLNAYPNALAVHWYRSFNGGPVNVHGTFFWKWYRCIDIKVDTECLHQAIVAVLTSTLKLHSCAKALRLHSRWNWIWMPTPMQCSSGALISKLKLNAYTRPL